MKVATQIQEQYFSGRGSKDVLQKKGSKSVYKNEKAE